MGSNGLGRTWAVSREGQDTTLPVVVRVCRENKPTKEPEKDQLERYEENQENIAQGSQYHCLSMLNQNGKNQMEQIGSQGNK